MSRPLFIPKHIFSGTGSLNVYSFDFKIEALTQLLVVEVNDQGVETQRVRGDDTVYLSGVEFDSNKGGGEVTLAVNLSAGFTLVLLLANDSPTQEYEFGNKNSFNLRRFENALDFVTGAVQRLAFKAKQTFRIHDADDETGFNAQLPPGITDAKNRTFVIDEDGTKIVFGPTTDEIANAQSAAIAAKAAQDAAEESAASSGVPDGGDEGAALVKSSDADGEAEWDNFEISGFSSRFNGDWSSKGLRDTLMKIIDIQYVAPLVSLTGSSQSLREKGDEVASITLSASVTKRSDDIARIRFLQGATEIADYEPPAETGTGVTTAPYSTPFSDNITFTVQVTDTGETGGPSTVSNNTSYSFVYPYYFGSGVPSLTAAQVASLTKNIITSNANLNRSFTTSDGDVYYFAYPASYGDLTSILDENSFETIGSWTKRTENITGLDGTAQSYLIYEFNNTVTAGSTDFTFRR